MSWMKTDRCPFCGHGGFDPDCDSVDVGVGVIEGNLRGICSQCGRVEQCACGMWLSEDHHDHVCPMEIPSAKVDGPNGTREG